MKKYSIPSTSETPLINFDPEIGFLEIRGNSLSENPENFYQPLMDSIDIYILNPQKETEVNIGFDYVNTDSSKCVLSLLKKLESVKGANSKVFVNWYYKNKDMMDAGEEYKMIVDLPFKMIAG